MILSRLTKSKYDRISRRGELYRYTNGFENFDKFLIHYYAHHQELGVESWAEFARWCDAFCGGPRNETTDECRRTNGATLRYDNETNIFGVLHAGGIIGTCCWSDYGRQYFEDECRK